MGSGMLNGGAIFCCVASIVLVIAAAATTEWMTACLSIDNVLGSVSNMIPGMGDATVKGASAMLKGKNMCINQGIYRVSFDMMGMMKADLPIEVSSLPAYAIVTSLALVVVVICVIVAGALLIAASCGKSDEYEKKSWASRRFTAASVMLGIAVVVTIGGMAVYTGATAKMVHQPLQYLAQFGASMSSLPNMFGGNDIPSMPSADNYGLPALGDPARRRRDLDLSDLGDLSNIKDLSDLGTINGLGDLSNINGLGDLSTINGLGDLGNINGLGDLSTINGLGDLGNINEQGDVGNVNGLGDLANINGLGDLGNINGPGDIGSDAIKNIANTMFSGMDPMYGYSFILGWVSLAFTILALCLSVAAKQSLLQRPYQPTGMAKQKGLMI